MYPFPGKTISFLLINTSVPEIEIFVPGFLLNTLLDTLKFLAPYNFIGLQVFSKRVLTIHPETPFAFLVDGLMKMPPVEYACLEITKLSDISSLTPKSLAVSPAITFSLPSIFKAPVFLSTASLVAVSRLDIILTRVNRRALPGSSLIKAAPVLLLALCNKVTVVFLSINFPPARTRNPPYPSMQIEAGLPLNTVSELTIISFDTTNAFTSHPVVVFSALNAFFAQTDIINNMPYKLMSLVFSLTI